MRIIAIVMKKAVKKSTDHTAKSISNTENSYQKLLQQALVVMLLVTMNLRYDWLVYVQLNI